MVPGRPATGSATPATPRACGPTRTLAITLALGAVSLLRRDRRAVCARGDRRRSSPRSRRCPPGRPHGLHRLGTHPGVAGRPGRDRGEPARGQDGRGHGHGAAGGRRAGFGAAYLQRHRDAWGWDTLDVDWEAIYAATSPRSPSSGSGRVSTWRDRRPLRRARLHDRAGGGTVVRSHALDLIRRLDRTTELGVTNTAFLEDGRTLMFSSSRDALDDGAGTQALDARAGCDRCHRRRPG